MSNSRAGMRKSTFLILTLCSFCTCSQPLHELDVWIGGFDNGTNLVNVEVDGAAAGYVDFDRQDFVFTVPGFITQDPGELFKDLLKFKDAMRGERVFRIAMLFFKGEEEHTQENIVPPESAIYPAEEIQWGFENSLICFVNHFHPPHIEVSWTKNGRPVTKGVSLSRYCANDDMTFNQISTLTITPSEGDIYSCTVEHVALERPLTKIWEAGFSHHSHGLDIFCGVALTVGLLEVAAGTFLFVKGHHGY